MKLKSIEVKGMWGYVDLKWNLNERVNILTGSNGTGKSTVLDLMLSTLVSGKLIEELVTKVKQVNIEFDNGMTLVSISFDDTLLELQKEAEKNEMLKDLWEDVKARIPMPSGKKSRLNRMGITASMSYLLKNRKLIPLADELNDLNVDTISTFDVTLPSEQDIQKAKTLKDKGLRSPLDMGLNDLKEKYAYYLGGLATRMEKYVKEGHVPSEEYIKNLYAQKDLFISIVNEMFTETGKHINIDNSQLEFVLDEGGKHISMYDLSSGEKQLLYILMTVLMEEQKDYILLMDEPEISLHVDWQEKLIDKILLLNPNCQLVIATHAPSLLLRGWHSFVSNISDLKIL